MRCWVSNKSKTKQTKKNYGKGRCIHLTLFCMIAAPKWIRGILLEGREGESRPLERSSILFINWVDNKAILNQGNAKVCGMDCLFVCFLPAHHLICCLDTQIFHFNG